MAAERRPRKTGRVRLMLAEYPPSAPAPGSSSTYDIRLGANSSVPGLLLSMIFTSSRMPILAMFKSSFPPGWLAIQEQGDARSPLSL